MRKSTLTSIHESQDDEPFDLYTGPSKSSHTSRIFVSKPINKQSLELKFSPLNNYTKWLCEKNVGAIVAVIAWYLALQLPVQSMPITTKIVSSNPVHDEVYSIQHYVIKFVSDLRQVSGFLQVFRFPSQIKL